MIKKHAPEAMTVYSFSYFKNSIIAIDTSILLYKFRYISDDNDNAHISGFLNKCLRYISYGIIPIFILDGKPPLAKKEILIKRSNQRQKIINRIEELNEKLKLPDVDIKATKEEIKKLSKQIIYITKEQRDECKELLECLGFNVINSPGEAETMCAILQKEGMANYTFTDDTDALVLGCKKVLRSNNSMNTFIEIDLDKVLNGLKLTFDQFVDLCILCGCDYCQTIPRIGHLTAYNLILEYKSIENVVEAIKDKYEIPADYMYETARQLFKNNINIQYNQTVMKNINENELTQFLLKKGFTKDFINGYIKKFKNNLSYYKEVECN